MVKLVGYKIEKVGNEIRKVPEVDISNMEVLGVTEEGYIVREKQLSEEEISNIRKLLNFAKKQGWI
jgi:hypothetical protein